MQGCRSGHVTCSCSWVQQPMEIVPNICSPLKKDKINSLVPQHTVASDAFFGNEEKTENTTVAANPIRYGVGGTVNFATLAVF